MLRFWKAIAFATLAFIVIVHAVQPASAARCYGVSATHSASSHQEALRASQRLAAENAKELGAKYGWRSYTMRARQVKGDTFFKAVRPEVPAEAVVGRPVVTGQTYTTCWTGVVVPYVCTSGSMVCRN
jgi:hypothetical protein